MLAADFGAIGKQVDSALGSVDDTLDSVDKVKKLPIIGKALSEVSGTDPSAGAVEAKDIVAKFRKQVNSALTALDKGASPAAIQNKIATLLGPKGINYLVDTNNNGAGADDVKVTKGAGDDITISLSLAKSFNLGSTDFSLGIGGLPFAKVAGEVNFGLAFNFDNLTFGWKNGAPFFGGVDNDAVRLGVTASLSGTTAEDPVVKGNIGFLHFTATDSNPDPELNASFKVPIADDGSASGTPTLDGAALLKLHLTASLGSGKNVLAGPNVSTDFVLDWKFGGSANAKLLGNAPKVSFNNVSVGLGGYLSNAIEPVIEKVQIFTKPLQPVIDVLDARLPVLSDLSHAIGGPNITLLDVAKVALGTGGLPAPIAAIVKLVVTLDGVVKTVNLIEADGSTQNVSLNLGDYDISGTQDFRSLPNFKPGDFDSPNIKGLKAALNGKITDIQAQVTKQLGNSDGAKAINGLISSVSGHPDNDIDLSFPLFDNPKSAIGLLLGQDIDLVKFHAKLNNSAQYKVPDFPSAPIAIGFEGGYSLDAELNIGYDTFGLRRFLNAKTKDPALLADGLYFGDNHFKLSGNIGASAGLSVVVFSASVHGGIALDLHLNLQHTGTEIDGDASKVRLQEIGPNLLSVGGALSGELGVTVKVGVDVPFVGFVGYQKDFNIAKGTVFSFDTPLLPNPFNPPPGPPNLASKSGSTLTLNIGNRANQRNSGINHSDGDENYSITSDPDQPGTLFVSAFGLSESFTGITKIVGDGGNGDDSIDIDDTITASVDLSGGIGNDTLTYAGRGNATLSGGDGNDTLVGGGGLNFIDGGDGDDTIDGGKRNKNAAPLTNQLFGGNGNDTLIGGRGNVNQIVGGSGDDKLVGGDKLDVLGGDELNPAGNDRLGNDEIQPGIGGAVAAGNAGDDRLVWTFGKTGPVSFFGGEGIDTVVMNGSDAADNIGVGPLNGGVVALVGKTGVGMLNVENLSVDALGGADNILIGDLSNTGMKSVSLDLVDLTNPDNAKDTIGILGSTQTDAAAVESEGVTERDFNRGKLDAGVTRVTFGAKYVIRLANENDLLVLNTIGGNDAVAIGGITGPTQVFTGAGDDAIAAGYNPASPALPAGAKPYAAKLEVDAGAGAKNAFVFTDLTPTGAVVTLTDSLATSNKVPLGVSFKATGGGFGSGVGVVTGTGNDSVLVKSTIAGILTAVATDGGDDAIGVGTSTTGNSVLTGIKGEILIDGGKGTNAVGINDAGATSGNGNVQVGPAQVKNFAGPSDNTPIIYTSTGGVTVLAIAGSNSASLAETFILNSAPAITLAANDGNDKVYVQAAAKPVAIFGGKGNDTVYVGSVTNNDPATGKLSTITTQNIGIDGGTGNNIGHLWNGAATVAMKYAVNQVSSKIGTILFNSGGIAFQNTQQIDIRGSSASDVLEVLKQPPSATTLTFVAGGGAGINRVFGPAGGAQWFLTGSGAGSIAKQVYFTNVANIVGGGNGGDKFTIADGIETQMQIDGKGGGDTLDYSAWTTNLFVDLRNGIAPAVDSFSGIANATGGLGDDILIGSDEANVLFGNEGDDILLGRGALDVLSGGAGRDILIGNDGGDFLAGGTEDDILIDGSTDFDNDLESLRSIRNIWANRETDYESRVQLLNSARIFPHLSSDTVAHDSSVDALSGGAGQDWFWAKTISRDGSGDALFDRMLDEYINDPSSRTFPASLT